VTRCRAKVAEEGLELPDTRIMIPHVTPKNTEENACFQTGAVVAAEKITVDPDLQAIIQRWTDLPEAVKDAILAMVKAARTSE